MEEEVTCPTVSFSSHSCTNEIGRAARLVLSPSILFKAKAYQSPSVADRRPRFMQAF